MTLLARYDGIAVCLLDRMLGVFVCGRFDLILPDCLLIFLPAGEPKLIALSSALSDDLSAPGLGGEVAWDD